MGIRSYKAGSTASSDKRMDVDDYKQSSSCLPLWPLALVQWPWRGRRQRQEHQKIEDLRKAIDKDRKDVQFSMDGWKLHRVTWRLRAKAWEKGRDISVGARIAGQFPFDTAYRYMLTVEGPTSGKKTIIVDFRTPEGREEALQWYESRYLSCIKNGNRHLEQYDDWEEAYQEYLCALEKGRDRANQASLRRTLLKGVPQVRWVITTAKRLPN